MTKKEFNVAVDLAWECWELLQGIDYHTRETAFDVLHRIQRDANEKYWNEKNEQLKTRGLANYAPYKAL